MTRRLIPLALAWVAAGAITAGCGNSTTSAASTPPVDTTVPVTGVTLKAATSLVVGGAEQLAAVVAPANATDTRVTWSTSDATVVTVNATGLITGAAKGTATVTVTTVDGGKTASCAVTVTTATVAVTGVSLAPATLSLFAGSPGTSATLTATVAPAGATNQNVTWSTSDASVATVSATAGGMVTVVGHAPGKARITVTTADGAKTAECAVTVAPVAVTGVTVKTATSVLVGASEQLTATVEPSNATTLAVTWKSSDPSIATVSATGLVTGVAKGTATVTVTTVDGGKTASCAVTVTTATVPVTGVTLDHATLPLVAGTPGTIGTTGTLSATIAPANATNQNLTWTSDNAAVATVSATTGGTVTVVAHAPGTANVTVTTADGKKTAVCVVTVAIVAVTEVTIEPPALPLIEGGSATLAAVVSPVNATDTAVTWSIDNDAVASLSSTAGSPVTVTAKAAGTANVTVTTHDGNKTAVSTVTVNARVYPVTGVTLVPTALTLDEGAAGALTATVSPLNATDAAVTWASDNEAVAIPSPTAGRSVSVIAKKAGVANITVTTHDGGKTAVTAVTVRPIPVNDLRLDQQTLLLGKLGSATSATLTATVGPTNASNKAVQWSSSDDAVATVSSTAGATVTVTAQGAGTATITAKAADGGLVATCAVNVALLHQQIAADTASRFHNSGGGFDTLYDNQYVESTVGALAYFAQNNGLKAGDADGGVLFNYYGAGSGAAVPGTPRQTMKAYVGIPAANVQTASPSVKVILTAKGYSTSGSMLGVAQHGTVAGGAATGAVVAVKSVVGGTPPPLIEFDGMPANVQLDVFNAGVDGTSTYVEAIRVEPSSTAVVDLVPPAEVSALTATADAANAAVTLTWTNPPNADLDHVVCSENSTALAPVARTSPSTCTFSGLATGAHTFTVKTVDTQGNASAGVTVTATLGTAGPLLDVTIPANTASTYLTAGSGGAYQTNGAEVSVGQLVYYSVGNGFKNGDGDGGIMTNYYGSSVTAGAVSMSAYVGVPAAVTSAKSTVTVTVSAKGYSGAVGKLGLAQQTSVGKGTVVEVKDLTASPAPYVFYNVPAGTQLDLFNAAANNTYVYIESIRVE